MKKTNPILEFFCILLALSILQFDCANAAQAKTAKTTQTTKKPTAHKATTKKKVTAKQPTTSIAKKTSTNQHSTKKITQVKTSAKTTSAKHSTTKTKIVHSKRIAVKHFATHPTYHPAHLKAAPYSSGIGLHSAFALIQDQSTGKVLYEKRSDEAVPIASITKLMTAMVALDTQPSLTEYMTISQEDVDNLRHSRSRLPVGTTLPREEILRLALMSSENRAASALARYYPGGKSAFVRAMNNKALTLGMFDTYFYDSTGLNAGNVASARDLARMVAAAGEYPLIRQMTSTSTRDVYIGRRLQRFNNTNSLVKNPNWNIEVSKTGFINEAGKCIVMKAWINSKPTIIVLLDSSGSMTRIADAMRVKSWLESPAYLSRQDLDINTPAGNFE